jgi:integrase
MKHSNSTRGTRSTKPATAQEDGTTPATTPDSAPVPKKQNGQPYKDFPLSYHRQTRQWYKKVRGKRLYFGTDPIKARDRWLREKDDRLAGRTPRAFEPDALTVEVLCNLFLESKDAKVATGELTQRSYDDYKAECKAIALHLGRNAVVEHLAPDDFRKLRTKLARGVGVKTLHGRMTRAKAVFLYAERRGLVTGSMAAKMVDEFTKPSKSAIERAEGDKVRVFESDEIRLLLGSANVNMRAIILLGVNCGMGNADIASLTPANVDLENGWLTKRRQKTGKKRRVPLWTETIDAIKTAMAKRTEPKEPQEEIFITKFGKLYRCEVGLNPISAEFKKLRESVGIDDAGKSFYALRHTFQTIGDQTRAYVAVRYCMGHVDNSISGQYREHIADSELLAVTTHVHDWLFPKQKPKPETTKKKAPAKAKRGAK